LLHQPEIRPRQGLPRQNPDPLDPTAAPSKEPAGGGQPEGRQQLCGSVEYCEQVRLSPQRPSRSPRAPTPVAVATAATAAAKAPSGSVSSSTSRAWARSRARTTTPASTSNWPSSSPRN